jgi:hypothetical protein
MKPRLESEDGGWTVLKDTDGIKEMEYDDGNGTKRYYYRRTWGGSGDHAAVGADEETQRQLQRMEAEMESMMNHFAGPMFRAFLGDPFGGASGPHFPAFRPLSPNSTGASDHGLQDFMDRPEPQRQPIRV